MKFNLLLLNLLLGSVTVVQAQFYSLSVSSGTYSDLVGATSLNGTMTWDDPGFAIPLGFDFQFLDKTLDTLYLSELSQGGMVASSPEETGSIAFFSAYGTDIIDRGYDFALDTITASSLSPISYVLEGDPGSRIMRIEWKNAGFYEELEDDGVSTDFVNFQMWLYEGSNQIEVHYGPNSITQPELSFGGETGPAVAFFELDFENAVIVGEAFGLQGNPSSPTVIEIPTIDTAFYLNGAIPDGTIYTFSNLITSTSDVKEFSEFSVIPNPADDFFTVSLSGEEALQEGRIAILNLSGQTIREARFTGQEEIDITSLNAGVYFVRLKVADRVGVKKLVVR